MSFVLSLVMVTGGFEVLFGWFSPCVPENGWGSYMYRVVLFIFLLCALSLRLPYIYGIFGFIAFVLVTIVPLFISVIQIRLADFGGFLGSFFPGGCPGYLVPFVFLLEIFSFFFIRSVVLVVRPIINLFFGYVGVVGGCHLIISFHHIWIGIFLLLFVFLYEVFVVLVHCFIVGQVLCFSQEY